MKLDELPNELIFNISTYLSLFDIGYSLIGVCNCLDKLFSGNKTDRRTLSFHNGHCSKSLHRAFLDDHNGFRTRMNVFIRSLRLDGFSNILCTHDILIRWANSTPPFLPSVRELSLSNMEFFYRKAPESLPWILTCGIGTNIIGQLDKFTLISTSADSWYIQVLHELIFFQASCHTMIFHVTDGMETWSKTNDGSLHVLIGVSGRQPCFPRTVYLTVSLKRFTELLLLLQPNATPCLEHLTVIFEHEYLGVCILESRYEPKDMLTESYLTTMNVIHLRTLTLRGSDISDFSMSNVLLIIRYLKMPNLKSLTLIHVQTSSLNQLIEFQQAIHSSSLWISLNYFCFSLYLPVLLRREYEATEFGDVVFNTSDWLARGWCVRHIVEESLSSPMLIVYTYPCDLRNDRILVNHQFVRRTIDHARQANVQHMIWLCRNSNIDYINLHSSDIVEHSLRTLSRVYHLKWHWYMPPIGFSSSDFMQRNSYFPPLHLRSLHLQLIGIDDTQATIYGSLLRNLLANALLLQCLSVPWSVVRELGRCHSSSTSSYHLKSLFLHFGRSQPAHRQSQPDYEPVDGSMLALLFPRLLHLSLCEGFFLIDKPLVNMLQNLIDSLTSVNHLFNTLHVSGTFVRVQPYPRTSIVLTDMRRRLSLTRDSSTFSVYSWEHYGVAQLIIWL